MPCVAHDSGAIIEAGEHGLADELGREFELFAATSTDALIYCDMTTGPHGQRMSVGNVLRRSMHSVRPRSPRQPSPHALHTAFLTEAVHACFRGMVGRQRHELQPEPSVQAPRLLRTT